MSAVDPAAAALSIACRICDAAAWHRGRCAWIAPALERPTERRTDLVLRPLGPDLASGTAGVGLFLGRLYAMTGERRLRRVARGALLHALDCTGRGSGEGLYVGAAGVAWAAVQGSSLLGSEELEDRARLLLRRVGAEAAEPDLHRGLAGTLLGVLDASRALGEGPPELAVELGNAILACGERDDGGGLSWATGPPKQRLGNLLGMAHGAAGIGLALAALAAATDRREPAEAAVAAARYERSFFDEVAGRWPDLRARTRTGMEGPTFTEAWCHGSPGIALSRMFVWRGLGDEDARREAETGLAITVEATSWALRSERGDFGLCHGVAGNADVLLEGARILPAPPAEWRDLAWEVARTGIARYEGRGGRWPCGAVGEVPSLMTGSAGIGMFLARLADPTVPSVLAIGADRLAPAATQEEARVPSGQEARR